MADGPTTRVEDVVVPEIFTNYTQQLTEEKSRIVQSGILARDPELDRLLAGGGLTFNAPSWQDLDNDAERTNTDQSLPFSAADSTVDGNDALAREPNPHKIGSLTEVAVRLNRNQSWSSSYLAATLAGADPMIAIANRVADYWTRRLQLAFVATWNGVIANNSNPNDHMTDPGNDGDFQHNIAGAAFSDGVTNFSAEAFLDAVLTMGDSQNDLTGMMVHSVVYNRMQKNNLIDFIPDARGEIMIPTFLGHEVVVDDGMPRNGSVYDTWIFSRGMARMGVGQHQRPTVVVPMEGAGNGGGMEVLYNRVQWCIHPTGHAFQGTPASGGPNNTGTANANDLDEAASWRRVFRERKQIKFARLVTREA